MDYKVTDTELTAVADAIRAKGSTSAPLTWESGFASAINAIPTGITPSGTMSIASNGVYDVTNYASADVNVSGGGGDTKFAEMVSRTIISVDDSTITTVGKQAFNQCSVLATVNLPNVTEIQQGAFNNCSNLASVNMPSLSSVPYGAFMSCYNLTSVSFPNVSYISGFAFDSCSTLTNINLPIVASISNSKAFNYCSNLLSADLPELTYLGSHTFGSCWALSMVSLPKVVTINNSAFFHCHMLLSLYLMGSSIPTLGSSNVFASTPIGGYTGSTGGVYGSIYVPSSLYSQYRTASYWSSVAARFVSV